jgi:hypothetical protein
LDKKHICGDVCANGYEEVEEQAKCLDAAEEKWDEIAPLVFEEYRKWIDEENGADEEITLSITLPKYIVTKINLLRAKTLHAEINNHCLDDKNYELIQCCFQLEKFIGYFLSNNMDSCECKDKETSILHRQAYQIMSHSYRIKKRSLNRDQGQ